MSNGEKIFSELVLISFKISVQTIFLVSIFKNEISHKMDTWLFFAQNFFGFVKFLFLLFTFKITVPNDFSLNF